MQFFNLIPKSGKLPNQEFSQWINEAYTTPLKALGFKLESISSVKANKDDLDFHVLIYRHDGKKEYRSDSLKDICQQDDDGQPTSTYTQYMGTLWVFIPYHP